MKDPLITTSDLCDLLNTSLKRIKDLESKIIDTKTITHLDALTLSETLTIAASAARGLEQRIPHDVPLCLSQPTKSA